MHKRRIIIDTDTASDDVIALLYALRQSDVVVEAITVVAGNLPLELCVKNAFVGIEKAGTYEPPVFKGAQKPLCKELFTSEYVHGSDGMGEMLLPSPKGVIQDDHAANAIVSLAKKYPGEIDLITLGPLTNLALATILEPNLSSLLSSVWVMGGTGSKIGNITPVAEFNLFVDPHAAQIVLDAKLKPRFVGWDVSTDETFLNEKDMEILEKGSETSRFALRCNKTLVEHNANCWGRTGFDLPDPTAMISFLHPSIKKSRERLSAR